MIPRTEAEPGATEPEVAVGNATDQLSQQQETAPSGRADDATGEAAAPSPLIQLIDQVQQTNRLFAQREQLVDRLHDELTTLRRGELEQAMAPLLRDLMRLFDDLERAEATAPETAAVLAPYRQEVSDILFRYGVERYDASEGERFDPKLHRALGTIATSDPAQEHTIAKILRCGFRNGQRTLRALEARVFRLAVIDNSETTERSRAT